MSGVTQLGHRARCDGIRAGTHERICRNVRLDAADQRVAAVRALLLRVSKAFLIGKASININYLVLIRGTRRAADEEKSNTLQNSSGTATQIHSR